VGVAGSRVTQAHRARAAVTRGPVPPLLRSLMQPDQPGALSTGTTVGTLAANAACASPSLPR
jgi:hypothetical protein